MNPEISVILPCYNVARWLDKCINSILRNDFTDYEIICINDCSTDDTLDKLNEFAVKDSRIRIIDLKQNGGLANGRRVGIQNALGKYTAFIDPDDWVDSNYLSALYRYVKNNPLVDLVTMPFCYKEYKWLPAIKSGHVADFVNGLYDKIIDITPEHPLMDTFFGRTIISISAWCKLYKTSVLRNLPPINVFYQEDLLMNLYASKNIKKMVITNAVKYHYRSGGGSATNPRMISDFLEVISLKKKWAEDNLKNYEKHYPWICFELKNVIYGWIARLIDNKKPYSEIKRLYEQTITPAHLEFLATTKASAPKSYESEDFQALLSKDFNRIYARAKSRISVKDKIINRLRLLFSY